MATLFNFPAFFSLSSHKLQLDHHQLKLNKKFDFNIRKQLPRIRFTLRDSSVKKPRGKRKVKSNEELISDIREFLSAVGLPEGHVPSMKELKQHGRNDLANIVRRRGYKLIRELLETRPNQAIDTPRLAENCSTSVDSEDKVTGQDKKVNYVAEDTSLPTEAYVTGNFSGGSNIDTDFNLDNHDCMPSTSSALDENPWHIVKGDENANVASLDISSSNEVSSAEKDIGSLDIELALLPDRTSMTLQSAISSYFDEKSYKLDDHDEQAGTTAQDDEEDSSDGVRHESSDEESTESQSRSIGEDLSENFQKGADDIIASDGSSLTSEHVEHHLTVEHPSRDDRSLAERPTDVASGKDLDVEIFKKENLAEIKHLKYMLHQKELEFSRLKEQIEREKYALSALQTKVEADIDKAQKLIIEKDEELLAAEESLSGLEEVQIQYRGDGEIVEVAGSFNGWHDQIKMDPHPSSSVIDPIGTRKSKLWSTVLWLYPGVYEIKFIVDGQWRIDPQREAVTKGTISNNILRVDR